MVLGQRGCNMKVALVCIAKNEDHYIKEWVDYNFKLGFDHIFIYENDWRCSLDNPNVSKIPFDGRSKQIEAYNNFLRHSSSEYQWVAFFDVDEFLVLKKHENVKKFLKEYTNFNGVGINWCLFGSNGHKKFDKQSGVLERFTKRKITFDQHVKTILKIGKDVKMGVHNPNIDLVGTNKVPFSGPFHVNGNIEIAQLNHYFTKSEEEFTEKIKKSRADNGQFRTMEEFYNHDFNEVEDLLALNFIKK